LICSLCLRKFCEQGEQIKLIIKIGGVMETSLLFTKFMFILIVLSGIILSVLISGFPISRSTSFCKTISLPFQQFSKDSVLGAVHRMLGLILGIGITVLYSIFSISISVVETPPPQYLQTLLCRITYYYLVSCSLFNIGSWLIASVIFDIRDFNKK
jgi:hypothetical protein